MESYEEFLKYDIYRAIEIKGTSKEKNSTFEDWMKANEANPTQIPNNPLLTDYDWVFEHAEELFCGNKYYYQEYQGFDQYLTLFKALINKYSLEEDHNLYLTGKLPSIGIQMKWRMFASKLISFIATSYDERLEQLLDEKQVSEYFFKYPVIYNPDMIARFGFGGIKKFLDHYYYSDYYTEDYRRLVSLIRNHPKIDIPIKVMLDEKYE